MRNPQSGRLVVVSGDITEQEGSAIVNAANSSLWLGSGVAGAIRAKGGPGIQEECDRHGAVPLGGAAITSGGFLKVPWVIHAAAMHIGGSVTRESLQNAVVNSLQIAYDRQLSIISFPAVGTGVGGFGIRVAAEIMISAVGNHLETNRYPELVRFVLNDPRRLEIFTEVAQQFGYL